MSSLQYLFSASANGLQSIEPHNCAIFEFAVVGTLLGINVDDFAFSFYRFTCFGEIGDLAGAAKGGDGF